MTDHYRLLVIDEDPSLGSAVAGLLRQAGYEVRQAATALDGLAQARHAPPDLILTNAALPDVPGAALCRQVRADPALAGLGLVLLATRPAGNADPAEALEAGADGYVAWPLPGRELVARVQAVLRLRGHASLGPGPRLRDVIDQSQDGIALTDEQGRVVDWNQAMECLTGLRRQDVLGRPIWEVQIDLGLEQPYTPERRAALQDEVQAALRTGRAPWLQQRHERGYRHPDGSHHFVEAVIFPVRTAGGFRLGSIARDVTERRQIEQALRDGEEQYHTLLDNLPIGVFRSTPGPEGGFLMANPAFLAMCGARSPADLAHLPVSSFYIDPGQRQIISDTILAQGSVRGLEMLFRRLDGSLLWGSATARLVRDPHTGRPLYFDGTLEDVTARRQAEQDLAWEAGLNAAMAELAQALISPAPLDEMSALVLEHAKLLTGSAHGFAGYVDPPSGTLVSPTLTRDVWHECEIADKDLVFAEFEGLWGWVLDNRRPLLTNAPADDPRSAGVPAGHVPVRRFLAAPACVGDRLLGIIAVANAERDYTPADRAVIERLASLLAMAVQRKQADDARAALAADLDERVKELNCLYAISNLAGRPGISLHELLAGTVELLPSAWRYPELAWARIELDGRAYATDNCCETPSRQAADIVAGGQVAGRVQVGYPQHTVPASEQPFLPEEHTLLAAVAEQMGRAVERIRAEDALRHYAGEQSALYAVTSAVAASLDVDHILSQVLEVVLPLLSAGAGWVILPGAGADDVPRVAAWRGAGAAHAGEPLALPRHCPAYAALSAGPHPAEPRLVTSCDYGLPQSLVSAGLHSYTCVPLVAGDQALGVLKLAWQAEQPPSSLNRTLLATIGRQIGLALRNAQLYQAARQMDRLQVLTELDTALAATLDAERVAEATLAHVARAVGAPGGVLLLLPAGSRPDGDAVPALILHHGWQTIAASAGDLPGWQAFLDRLQNCHQVAPLDARELPVLDGQIRIAALLGLHGIVVPIHSDERLVAVLLLGGRSGGRAFSDEDRTLALAAAGRAGQALHSAGLYAELRTLLHERERAQAQLVYGEKMAALGRLIATIAHEINNPIQSVQGCLALAGEELDGDGRPDTLRRYLHIADVEIERIAAMVRRVRGFYRPAGAEATSTDVDAVLDTVLELTAQQFEQASVRVVRETSPGLPPICANPDQLKQVFLNLALNALDAMPGGGRLHIRTGPGELPAADGGPGRPAVCVEFADSGEGIAPEAQARLFEPFFTTREEGSGLGLYISYNIVAAHQGQIQVASRPGEGTTLSVLLPLPAPVSDLWAAG